MYPNIEKDKTLKQKTVSAMIWNSIGQFGGLAISLISNLVLTRLLLPSDFGYIGMLSIFINVSAAFISGGFGTALVQKLKPTQTDYSTVFYWNIIVSIFCVVILFFIAPDIARFYNMPLLKGILRLQSLNLILSSLAMVPTVYLQRFLDFRALAVRNLVSISVGVAFSIIFALLGFGVWSLVYSSLISTSINVVLLWGLCRWRPLRVFSIKALKELFSFGSMIFCSNILGTIFSNIQGLIIGKFYSASTMGYYSQAKKLEEIPTIAISRVVNEVSLPMLSKFQEGKQSLVNALRKNVKCLSFLNFPLMVLAIVIARPLITILFTTKWETSISYFQILCFGAMLRSINTINGNALPAYGKAKGYFYMQLCNNFIGIFIIFLGAKFGIKGLLWATALTNYLFFLINSLFSKYHLGYGLLEQIKDIGLCYMISIVVGIFTMWVSSFLSTNNLILIFIQSSIYIFLYLILSYFLKFESFFFYAELLKNKIKK